VGEDVSDADALGGAPLAATLPPFAPAVQEGLLDIGEVLLVVPLTYRRRRAVNEVANRLIEDRLREYE
jgi:hypothetical protein